MTSTGPSPRALALSLIGGRHIDPTLIDVASDREIDLTTASGTATRGYPPPS